MIQFNIKRFSKLARWSLTNDKKYHVKSFLQMFVVLLLFFLFFTSILLNYNSQPANYQACGFAAIAVFAITPIIGSSFMFYSMSGKHDMQTLLMLPASNLEKYLMRYISWILLLPLYLVAFLAADLLQYLFGLIVGHEEVRFVASTVVNMVSDFWHKYPSAEHPTIIWSLVFVFTWIHSVYALGATFFRSNKYNWIPTTLIVVLLAMFLIWISPDDRGSSALDSSSIADIVESAIYVFVIGLNFWLSYRLFCRRQVIGKLVNL